jgi:Ca2+-binding EF-hand superfamily protein
MRKTIALVMSAGLGLAALGGVALADKGQGMFGRADTNGDGFVSKDEFAAGRTAMFAKLDANGDGSVDQAELDKAREAWHQRRAEKAQADGTTQAETPKKEHKGGGFMARIDTDSDGKVTTQEFAAAGDKMFAKFDANGDGKLAQDEMPKHRKHNDAPAEGAAPAQ